VAALFNTRKSQLASARSVQLTAKKLKKYAINMTIKICQEGLLQDFSEKCTTLMQLMLQSPKIVPCAQLSFLAMVVSTAIHF
jgi:hypothetical protein